MRKTTSGFTIVELLIVVVIIAILAAITIATFTSLQKRARDSERDTAVASIMRGLAMYRGEYGVYPPACSSYSQDCYISDLVPYLNPYLGTTPLIKPVGSQVAKFFGQATGYTLLIEYESKPSCKTGYTPSSSYYSAYPMC